MEREEGPLSYRDQDQIEQEKSDRINEEFKVYLATIEDIERSLNLNELNSIKKKELKEKFEALIKKLG